MGTGPFNAVIPELVPVEQRGRASGMMGFMQLGAQLVIGVFALAASVFLKGNSVLAIYAFLILISIAFAWWASQTIKGSEPLPLEEKVSHENIFKAWLSPWKSKDFCWVWFTRFLTAVGFYLVVTYLLFFLKDIVFHGDPTKADEAEKMVKVLGLVMSLSGAIGSVIAGRWADTWGRKKVIYVAGTIMAATLIPPIIYPVASIMVGVALMFGFGYGAYLSADWALASDILPNKGQEGTDMGVWHASVPSTQIIAGLLGGLIGAMNAGSAGSGFRAAFAFAAAALFVGSILVRQVKGSS